MKVKEFFQENNLSLENKKILIASSGGPDSMALIDMMTKLVKDPQRQIFLAHVDHKLRDDSYLESKILKKYCKNKKINILEKSWSVQLHPESGIEAAARKFRYSFFKEIIKNKKIDYLLTAHHGDDLLENILLKLIRSGNVSEMNSLVKIGTFSSALILRPLLAYSKQELLNYDKENDIDFVEDKTNHEDEVLRNRLRHHVIPLLKKENTQIIDNANRFLNSENDLEKDKSALFESFELPKIVYGALCGKLNDLKNLSLHQQKEYFEWLITKSWHQRVKFKEFSLNGSLISKDGFSFITYQKWFYIFKTKDKQYNVNERDFELDKIISLNKEEFLLTHKQQVSGMKKIGYFYAPNDLKLSLKYGLNNERLELANGEKTKSKKKFAQAHIPNVLRKRALVIKDKKNIYFVENIYRWQKYDENYICYNIFKNYEE